jgi:hypothetical protein
MWRKISGASVPQGSQADGNGDGMIGLEDYQHWKSRFDPASGNGAGAGSAGGVPEPSTLVVSLSSCLLSLFLTKRRCFVNPRTPGTLY